jgi:CubicO group peptidase (beta-lactamase class C family)
VQLFIPGIRIFSYPSMFHYSWRRKVPDFGPLEKTVVEELKETNTPGAVISVIQDGNILFEKGFGISSVETKLPVSPAKRITS